MIESDADFSSDPSDYYFRIDEGEYDGATFVFITPKSYYNNNHCLLDTELEIDAQIMMAGLGYETDSTYSYEGDPDQARKICRRLGMEEKSDMSL